MGSIRKILKLIKLEGRYELQEQALKKGKSFRELIVLEKKLSLTYSGNAAQIKIYPREGHSNLTPRFDKIGSNPRPTPTILPF